MRLCFFFTACLLFFTVKNVNAQKLTPFAQNNGGGFASKMEWSIGESASIELFKSSTITLSTGLLQPLSSVVTGITEYGPAVFGNQIYIGPNPTTAILHFKSTFNSVGSLQIQILDAKSQLLTSLDAGHIFYTYEKELSLEAYPSGVYYVKAYFQPKNAISKTGIFKIIKL